MATPNTFNPEILSLIESHPSRKRSEDKIGIGFGEIKTPEESHKRANPWHVVKTDSKDKEIPTGNSAIFLQNGIEFGNLQAGQGVIK